MVIRNSPYIAISIYLQLAVVWVWACNYLIPALPGEILSPRIRNLISNLGLILGSAAVVYFWITGSSSRTTDSPDQYLPGHANAANEMLQKLFDRVPAMITVYHPDMDRFLVNREFEEVTGWSNREANSPL